MQTHPNFFVFFFKKMAKEDPNNGGEGGDNKLEWQWKRVHKSTHIYRALNIIRKDVQEF